MAKRDCVDENTKIGHADTESKLDKCADGNDESLTEVAAISRISKSLIEGQENKSSRPKLTATLTKRKIQLNLAVITIAFVLLFSASGAFTSIQSTVNKEEGLGTAGLSALYFTMVLTSLFITPITLPNFTQKRIMAVAMLFYVCYYFTGFYSSWYTIIPGSIIIGFGASHLWPAQQAYITDLATEYSRLTNKNPHIIVSSFLSIFYGGFFTYNIWGNLCSSLVFAREADDNETASVDAEKCGAQFCFSEPSNRTNIVIPSMEKMYIFSGFCAGIGVIGALTIAISLVNITSPMNIKVEFRQDVCCKLRNVLKLYVTSLDQQLLIITSILCGMSTAFISGEFTVAFVSCPFGLGFVGYSMMTFGLSCALASVLLAKISKSLGHIFLFGIATVAQVSASVTMLLWTPNHLIVIFILAGLWGVGDAVLQPTTATLYSLCFVDNRDVALSSFRVLNSLGLALSFAYSSVLCLNTKIYIYIIMTSLSLVCMIVLAKRRKEQSATDSEKCDEYI